VWPTDYCAMLSALGSALASTLHLLAQATHSMCTSDEVAKLHTGVAGAYVSSLLACATSAVLYGALFKWWSHCRSGARLAL